MNSNLVIAGACFVLAAALLVSAVHDIIRTAYKLGYDRGFSNCEKWITEQGLQVDGEREKIWRGEA